MSVMVFIPARLGSTRLRRKHLMKIKGKPVIQLLIERVKRAVVPNSIVLCTTNSEEDNLLINIAQRMNIKYFRGSESDVLDRCRRAARKFDTDYIVNVDGDDIFCDPMLIDATANMLKGSIDFVMWQNLPLGAAPIGIKSAALEKICHLKQTTDTETGWSRFFTETGLFKVKYLSPADSDLIAPHIRLTLDYREDLMLFRKIYANLKEPFSLKDIIKLFERKPELIKINEKVKDRYKQDFNHKAAKIRLK